MKKILLLLLVLLISQTVISQNLDKMSWFNEPSSWSITKEGAFKMFVTPRTDYWRVTHYGFTVDDAPFYYGIYGGEFEAKVKIIGDYRSTFDQMGLMIRLDEKNWVKAGAEFVDGKFNISTVVTHNTSDWSIITLDKLPSFIWIKVVRSLDALEVFYSYDDKTYSLMRICYMQDNAPVMVGMMAASPDGEGFEAVFENFTVKQQPDKRRLEWSKKR